MSLTTTDQKAKALGMKYKVVAVNGEFEPLYCRNQDQVAIACKDWTGVQVRIQSLKTAEESLREAGLI